MPELIVKNLNYDMLKNISFNLTEKTLTAIIGKNDSGKTYLLECIAGLLEYNGSVKINNNIVVKSSKLNKNIGIFLGTINLIDDTVFSNLIEPLSNLNIELSKSKKMAYEISENLGIGNLINKNINDLSYYQKKVVSLAKSIIHNPYIILLDNPFEGLDLYYKNKITQYLKKLAEENNSIVLFTTEQGDDLMLSDKIIILNEGKLSVFGERNEVLKKEENFTKNGLKLPFAVDLSNKLITYNLINDVIYDTQEMVNSLWK